MPQMAFTVRQTAFARRMRVYPTLTLNDRLARFASVARSNRCWTFFCSRLAFCCSWVRSPTPMRAIGSEEAAMIFDHFLAGVVIAGLMIYLVYALLQPEKL